MNKDRRNRALCFATALTLSLTGCSSVPDALNPVEWYESSAEAVGGWFSDDDAEQTGDTGSYPNVSSVPETPSAQVSSAERAEIREQLVADRDNAQYDDSSPAPVIADASAASASGTAAAASGASAESEPLKPVRMTSSDEATRQIAPQPRSVAALPSAAGSRVADTAPRSSLWPNSPPPASEGDRAVTSARVGEPMIRRPGTTVRRTPRQEPAEQVAAAASAPARAAETPSEPVTIEPDTLQVASVPEETAMVPTPAPAPAPAPSAAATDMAGGLVLTPPAAGSFNFDDPSVIVDETALPGVFSGYASGQGGSYQAGVIRFGNGAARLSSADQGVIRELVPLIREYNATVEIVGHASSRTRNMDPFQHKLVNFEISLKRANAVAQALINAGAPSDRISVQAVGDSQPMSSEAMPAGEADNRRAEIYLVY